MTRFVPNAAERCVTCHAQAFVLAIVKGADLYYCGHHFHKYREKLSTVADLIEDRTDLINVKPSQSSPD